MRFKKIRENYTFITLRLNLYKKKWKKNPILSKNTFKFFF